MKLPLTRRRSATPLERALKLTSLAARALPAVRSARTTMKVARFTRRLPILLGLATVVFAIVKAVRGRGGGGGGEPPAAPTSSPPPVPGTTADVGIAPDLDPAGGTQGDVLGDAVPTEGAAIGGAEVPGEALGADIGEDADDLPSPAAASGADLPDPIAAEGVIPDEAEDTAGLGAMAEAGADPDLGDAGAAGEATADPSDVAAVGTTGAETTPLDAPEIDVDGPNESAPGHHPDESEK